MKTPLQWLPVNPSGPRIIYVWFETKYIFNYESCLPNYYKKILFLSPFIMYFLD